MAWTSGSRAARIAHLLATGLLAACLAGSASARDVRQSQRDFEAALAHSLTTAPAYILITAIDARTGVERTDCTAAAFLVGALLREHGTPVSTASVAEIERAAGSSLDHRFVFHNEAALANLGWGYPNPRREEACRLIRSGQAAFMTDRSGQISPGYVTGHEPATPPSLRRGGIWLTPIPRSVAATALRIDSSSRPGPFPQPRVHLVGAYRLALPNGARPVGALAPGFLPLTVRADNGRCFTISADYVGDGLRYGAATPSRCTGLDRGARGNPPVAPHAGLRFVNSAAGYSAWADDRTGQTLITSTSSGAPKTVLIVNMAVVGMCAIDSPASHYSSISLVGSLAGEDALVTIGLDA